MLLNVRLRRVPVYVCVCSCARMYTGLDRRTVTNSG